MTILKQSILMLLFLVLVTACSSETAKTEEVKEEIVSTPTPEAPKEEEVKDYCD